MGKKSKRINHIAELEAIYGSNLPGIYKITYLPTEMSYVGQTLLPILERWYQHMNNDAAGTDDDIIEEESKHIDAIFNLPEIKGNKDTIMSEFAFEVLDIYPEPFNKKDPADRIKVKQILDMKEAFFIKKFNTKVSGYNQTIGNHKELLDEALAANYHYNHTMSESIVDIMLDLF